MEKFLKRIKNSFVWDRKALLSFFRAFFNSFPFYIVETVLALVFVVLRQEVLGAVVFVMLLSVLLVVCDDILPTTLPFLLLCTFTTNCYNSYNTFIGYAIYAPIPICALLFHFLIYRKPMRFGASIWGLYAVGFAVTLGGVGDFTVGEYVRGGYYMLGLGFGMIAAYYLMKSEFAVARKYDLKERFSWIMALLGILATAMVLVGYLYFELGWKNGAYTRGFSSNNISTILMFAMPFGAYLGTRKRRRYMLLSALFYCGICLTHSRGGLLFGTIEFWVCCTYWSLYGRRKWVRFLSCAMINTAIMGLLWGTLSDIVNDGFLADGAIVGSIRYDMIWEAVDNFIQRPFVGTGILDDSISYGAFNKAGTMTWYHMMIPQIVGSMGLIGVAAYGYQFYGRAKLVFAKRSRWSLCLGISYLGVFLMSQVNPGEFCPLPFGLLAVLLFILQERRLENNAAPLWQPALSA